MFPTGSAQACLEVVLGGYSPALDKLVSWLQCDMMGVVRYRSGFHLSVRPVFCLCHWYMLKWETENGWKYFSLVCSAFAMFFFHLFLLVEANYFTILLWFLPYIDMNQPWIYMYSPSRSPLPPPSPPDPSGSSQCTSPEHLSHASNLGWWSVSSSIVYMFRCSSLKTSHPRLLPQSPPIPLISLLTVCWRPIST